MKPRFEHVQYREGSLHVDRFRSERYSCPWHLHDELELTLIEQGKGMRFVGDSIEEFADGDLVFLNSSLPHCWHAQGDRHGEPGTCAAIVCQFRPDFLGKGLLETPEFAPLTTLYGLANRGLAVEGVLKKDLTARMLALPGLTIARRATTLLEILLELLERCEDLRPLASTGFQARSGPDDHSRLARVFSLMNREHHRRISLEDAARSAAMTRTSFCRYFKASTGKTFSHLLNEIRISHACRQLTETDDKVVDVAQSCGYSNLSYFNSRFRQITGQNPRAFRNAHRVRGTGPFPGVLSPSK